MKVGGDQLVQVDDLLAAIAKIGQQGVEQAAANAAGLEPQMMMYIRQNLLQIAGRLTLSRAPSELIGEMNEQVLALCLAIFDAQRQAQHRLWAKTLPNTPLAKEVDLLMPKPKTKAKTKPKTS